jgi:hypothetical protein
MRGDRSPSSPQAWEKPTARGRRCGSSRQCEQCEQCEQAIEEAHRFKIRQLQVARRCLSWGLIHKAPMRLQPELPMRDRGSPPRARRSRRGAPAAPAPQPGMRGRGAPPNGHVARCRAAHSLRTKGICDCAPFSAACVLSQFLPFLRAPRTEVLQAARPTWYHGNRRCKAIQPPWRLPQVPAG